MKKLALTLVYLIFIMTVVLLALIVIELRDNGIYTIENIKSDLKLTSVIVFPQVIVLALIFYFLKRNDLFFKK
jgi:hypothetical protein